MSCFVSLKRVKSALLVIDLDKAKELQFRIEKNRNCAGKEINDFAPTTWNRIRAYEEEKEFDEIQQIFSLVKNDTSVLVFAFDHEGFLNIWVINDDFIFRKVYATIESILTRMVEILRMVKVNVDRTSSFRKTVSVVNTHNPLYCWSGILSRKPQPKGTVGKISKLGSRVAEVILKELFQLVIDPVKKSPQGNKLIIVPDQLLFFAPFSSLVDEKGRFLPSKYSIQITPSLHTLKASMHRINDPTLGFALFVGNPKTSLEAPDLPGAIKEVEHLVNIFQTAPLLGRKARKRVVMQLLGGASIIHIAAHAEPSAGEILLAQDQPCLPVLSPDSYLLTQRDIQSIIVQARLVVLCCCYTGQGKVSSEGVVGITRSFLAAGARSVLATLWPIDDMATKELIEKFYFMTNSARKHRFVKL